MWIFLLLSSCLAQLSDFEYGVTIDAGSSGSRIYVYQWLPRVSSSSTPPFTAPTTNGSWSNKTIIGISQYSNPQDAADSILGLLSFAKNVLSALTTEPISSMPIFLGATAGMRLLSVPMQTQIMDAIRLVLANSGFYFEPQFARIISGEEEGVYGWIATNFLLGSLGNASAATVGALDLGGASTQITFQPPVSTPILAGYFPFRVQSVSYGLYTHSYLLYGINQLQSRMDVLLAGSKTDGDVDNPCMSPAFSRSCIGCDGDVTMVGSGNLTQCRDVIRTLLLESTTCLQEPCAVAGVYQPGLPPSGTFYAFSTFGYLQEDTGMPATASLQDVLDLSQGLCTMSYQQLATLYPQNDNTTLALLCLMSTYTVGLLHDGYGFDLLTSKLVFGNKINKISLGWALGSILYQTNLMGWMIPQPTTGYDKKTVEVAAGFGAVLLTVFIILTVWLAHYRWGSCCRGGRHRRSSYDHDEF